MPKFLGIDPGRNGAIALWDTHTGKLDLWNMPDTPQGVLQVVRGLPEVTGCALESPIYMAQSGHQEM
jgi:hypothetical protein